MRLFIFSSNRQLLKSITLAIFIFSVYSLSLLLLQPKVTTFQNQWVNNYSVAEKYIYAQKAAKFVIVGSSMSARLAKKNLDVDAYNLSFVGGSPLTGLSIINRSQHIPKTILIETNILEKQLNKEMLAGLFTPIIWKIREHILSLQYTYQPINIFLTLIKNKFDHSEGVEVNDKPDKKRLALGLKIQYKELNKFKYLTHNKEIAALKKLIDHFDQIGVKIIFFQMPVDKTILFSRKYLFRKSILIEMFPGAEFHWVGKEDVDNYQTRDGVHLVTKSAVKYASILNKIIRDSK